MKQKQNNDKIVGYVILIAGLCVMGFSIASMISVFISGKVPVNILTTNIDSTQSNGSQNNSAPSAEKIMEPLNPMFNVLIWFIMAYILLAGGGRVASLGIKMMKASLPDVVTIKETQVQPSIKND